MSAELNLSCFMENENYILKELHAMSKEFIGIRESIAEIKANERHRDDKINELLAGNKDMVKILAEYKKDSDKKHNQLLVKVTVISTLVTTLGAVLLKKILLAAI